MTELKEQHLPPCHKAREELADLLAEAGLRVLVNRFGTGNAEHSGRPGCGVRSIEIHCNKDTKLEAT